MMNEYAEIRKQMEEQGYKISDEEFEQALIYTRLKAKRVGKKEDYLPLLLPDVIKEVLYNRLVNELAALMMGVGI